MKRLLSLVLAVGLIFAHAGTAQSFAAGPGDPRGTKGSLAHLRGEVLDECPPIRSYEELSQRMEQEGLQEIYIHCWYVAEIQIFRVIVDGGMRSYFTRNSISITREDPVFSWLNPVADRLIALSRLYPNKDSVLCITFTKGALEPVVQYFNMLDNSKSRSVFLMMTELRDLPFDVALGQVADVIERMLKGKSVEEFYPSLIYPEEPCCLY